MGQVNWLDKANMGNLIYPELGKVIEIVLLEGMTSRGGEDK